MTTKRILFAVMCVLLVLVVVVGAIVVSKVMPVFQALSNLGGGSMNIRPGTSGQTTDPETSGTTAPSEPSGTTVPTDPPHEHNYNIFDHQRDPSCDYSGYTVYKCECGDTDMVDIKEPLGHNYVKGEKVAVSCVSDGYVPYVCTNCGDEDRRNVVEATGHDYDLIEQKEPTCEEDGGLHYVCSGCGDVVVDSTPALGHVGQWEVTRLPSEGDPGEETLICETCGEIMTRDVQMSVTGVDVISGSDETGSYDHYTVYVGIESAPRLFVYQIRDYSGTETVDYEYTEAGLLVGCNGRTHTMARCSSTSLIIEAESTDPTDPSEVTEPSEPTQGSEPTGVPQE